jgi:GMC oxidoreductase
LSLTMQRAGHLLMAWCRQGASARSPVPHGRAREGGARRAEAAAQPGAHCPSEPFRPAGLEDRRTCFPEESAVEEFRYIVIGAGTGGCVLAARLSEDAGAEVLLLEAADPERTRAMTVPAAWPDNLASPADWPDVTTRQADAGVVAYPRGRGLGGSGSINAMAHVRPGAHEICR